MRSISLKLALISAAALLAGAAQAQSEPQAQPQAQAQPAAQARLTDAQFVKASQCVAMTRNADQSAAMEALVRAEQDGRAAKVALKAEKVQAGAKTKMNAATPKARTALEARFTKECEPLLAARTTQTAEAAAPAKKGMFGKMAAGVKGAARKMAFWSKKS